MAYYHRGLLYIAGGEIEKAFIDFNRPILLNPEFPHAYCNRGYCHQSTGNHGLALADFQKAIILGRGNHCFHNLLPLVHWNRGISYKFLGEYERAIGEHNTAIRLSPGYAAAFRERTSVLMLSGQFTRAMSDLNEAVKLRPRTNESHKALGEVCFFNGDFVEAAKHLRHALLGKSDPYTVLFLYLACAKAGQEGSAELKRNAAKLPSSWPAPVAELYLGGRQPEELLQSASTPIERGEAAFYIGEWHLLRDNPSEAIAFFKPPDKPVANSSWSMWQRGWNSPIWKGLLNSTIGAQSA